MILYINQRLNQWAHWCLKRRDAGLGFPAECSYTRLIARAANGHQSPEFDEHAWEIEQAVNALNPMLKETVRVFYLRTGTVEQKSRDCHCCSRTLFRRVDNAHTQIMDWLNGYYAENA